MEHAAILLEQTDLTIDEITDICGYASSTYFIAAFHKHHGKPPGKYRLERSEAG
jgi:AraC-like DNA-binding protein